MRRLVTISTAFALALVVTTASGQPPKVEPPKKADKPVPNPADATDAAIASALAADPDVKMAQAKIHLAEAELAKARQAITLKVLALKSRLEQAKVDVRAAELALNVMARDLSLSESERLARRGKFETTTAALAAVEAEWKLLTATSTDSALKNRALDPIWLQHLPLSAAEEQWLTKVPIGDRHLAMHALAARRYHETVNETAALKGPMPDRLRAVLDKPIKLGAKGETLRIDQAMELFKKEAGFDVPVRGELFHPRPKVDEHGGVLHRENGTPIMIAPQVVSEGETLPVGAWLQLYQDVSGGTFYVREYGLLLADKKAAPPDAPTLTEFWKQKPPATKPEPKPEPAPAPGSKPK